MIDKIIQITDTITNDGEGQTLGLSESGKLYELTYEGHWEEREIGTSLTGSKKERRWIIDKKYWKLLIESPKIEK